MKPLPSFKLFLKAALFLYFVWPGLPAAAQKTYFGNEAMPWENNKHPDLSEVLSEYAKADIVILEDNTRFYFSPSNNKLVRRLLIKINNRNGLEVFNAYKLPESFDEGYDAYLYKQGRRARIKTPFISNFQLINLAARKFTNGVWRPVAFDYRYETRNWMKAEGRVAENNLTADYRHKAQNQVEEQGRFIEDNLTVFRFAGLHEGDIFELQYELQFGPKYGSNLFYLYGHYPKLLCNYEFNYKINANESAFEFILPVRIADSLISKTVVPTDKESVVLKTFKIKMRHVNAVNYPANAFESKSLPHVALDFSYRKVVVDSFPTPEGKLYEYGYMRPKNFEWMPVKDTNNYYTKVYVNYYTALRKFVASLPPISEDSSHRTFFKALCDTLNNFRYISYNQLFYNEKNLLDVSSPEHLLKRRLVGSSNRVCEEILNDNGVFYYLANIQDKRYGEHNYSTRAHYGYERDIFAMPSSGSYIYFMPRYDGIKYHLNELPFYLEGSTAFLSPMNFQKDVKDKGKKFYQFIETHQGTFNENTRTENGTFKISLDSLKVGINIKESLSGQFSTVLRHLYLNEYIDSTISPYYFKKCTDKPNASHVKIKLSSNITDFPFRYTFNCSENLALQSASSLNVAGWFSFPISRQVFPELPTHDYYFDFEFSDFYNFLLEFDRPVEISNISSFSKHISNDYFELESEIIKNSETAYLLRVKLQVLEKKIPETQSGLLVEILSALDELNNFSLLLHRK